jgi:hypothetical protein
MIHANKKSLLLEFINYTCEGCHLVFDSSLLEIHRLNRKGSYADFRNLKVLCKNCHRKYHQNEFSQVRSR